MKTYAIIDPCYFIDFSDWNQLMRSARLSDDFNQVSIALIQKYLDDQGINSVVFNPGLGDVQAAVPEMDGVSIIGDSFTTDSGLLSVVETSDALFDYWKHANTGSNLQELITYKGAQIVELCYHDTQLLQDRVIDAIRTKAVYLNY